MCRVWPHDVPRRGSRIIPCYWHGAIGRRMRNTTSRLRSPHPPSPISSRYQRVAVPRGLASEAPPPATRANGLVLLSALSSATVPYICRRVHNAAHAARGHRCLPTPCQTDGLPDVWSPAELAAPRANGWHVGTCRVEGSPGPLRMSGHFMPACPVRVPQCRTGSRCSLRQGFLQAMPGMLPARMHVDVYRSRSWMYHCACKSMKPNHAQASFRGWGHHPRL